MEFCQETGKPLKEATNIISNEKIPPQTKKGKGIAKPENDTKGFPHKCKKCKHEFAEVTDLGIFYSDEASIHLYKCKKCGNVERESYGSGNA